MRRAVHAGVHPDLAEALNNVALLLYETGDHAAAGALYQEALDMARTLHGPQHENIATALMNVGQVLHDQGEYARAEANYGEALAMQRALLGDGHPDLVTTMNNLAFLYYDQGRVPEAIATLREAHALARTALGEDHPDVGADRHEPRLLARAARAARPGPDACSIERSQYSGTAAFGQAHSAGREHAEHQSEPAAGDRGLCRGARCRASGTSNPRREPFGGSLARRDGRERRRRGLDGARRLRRGRIAARAAARKF